LVPAAPAARIAMWSGPRTVSTALMRAWENRPDTAVVDEPLYAFYLARTGIDHPGRAEVLASQPDDWRVVLDRLTRGPVPGGRAVYYQKHMTHHLLPEVDRRALAPLRHAHLIRDPAQLLASYAKVRSAPVLADLGIAAQAEIFEEYGGPVLDSGDLLAGPEPMLRALCTALDLPFDEAMLSWPPGPRESDGVWGRYWYDNVWRSTGFGPHRAATQPLPAHLDALADQCHPHYERLHAHRLRPQASPPRPPPAPTARPPASSPPISPPPAGG
jgi:hypothetical protein